MPRPRSHVPTYRLHKPTGQAVVTVRLPDGGRRDVYLGPHNSEASKAEYRRVLAALDANQPTDRRPGGVTVAELLLAYTRYAGGYYRDPATGKPTNHLTTVKLAVRAVRSLYAPVPVAEFGPRDLRVVRDGMIAAGLSRKEVNRRVGIIRKLFRWGMGEDLVPPDVYQRLTAIEGLRAGRTEAPDRPRVRPADPAHVEAALPFMPPPVAAVVRLQRMTGARCGELVLLRPRDIDRANPDAWEYRPAGHKGTWRGKDRVVYLGRQCQAVLAPFLLRCGGPDAYVFSPRASESERVAKSSRDRLTPRWPSHMARNERKRAKNRARNRHRKLGERYSTGSVRQAIGRACRKAGVPVFRPHQVRHLAAHEVRAEFGIDVARAVLGHSMAAMSEHYSREVDRVLALKSVAKFG